MNKLMKNIRDAVRRLPLRAIMKQFTDFMDLRDAHAYAGLGMLFHGLYMAEPAAAWCVCGLILFWIGVKR